MINFETSIHVERPLEEVFAFVSDPLLFPRWNSAVQTVHAEPGEARELGSTYAMQRQIPTGQVENDIEVFAREEPNEFGIRTTSGPTPFVYSYRFASHGVGTVVHLDASARCQVWQPCSGRSRRAGSGEASTRISPLSSERLRRARETHNPPLGRDRTVTTSVVPVSPVHADRGVSAPYR